LEPTVHVTTDVRTNQFFMDQWEYAIRHGMAAPQRADWDHINRTRLANDALTRPQWYAHINRSWSPVSVVTAVGAAAPSSNWNPLRITETAATIAGRAVAVADGVLLYVAKRDGQKVLNRAWRLQENRMAAVALARDMDSALGVFKNPDGKAAVALADSAARYGATLKHLTRAGHAATIIGEGAYLMRIHNEHPDKLGHAVGATATNVAGAVGAAYLGAATGTKIGLAFAPVTGGMSIPIGAAIGGVGGFLLYDWGARPLVRQAWTGLRNDP
jgi:hypothetical protein